jgi:hypothetical protein
MEAIMSARKLFPRLTFAALALAALVSAVPAKAAAPVVVTTSRYSITFPDGWMLFAIPGSSDTVKYLLNLESEAGCHMMAVPQANPLTAQEIAALMAGYAAGDSLVKTDGGTKTIGGKTFSFVEFKQLSSDDSSGRGRFYYTTAGNLLFHASVVFDVETAATIVPQVEGALATLTLNATTGLRAAALRGSATRAATLDVLGRSGADIRQARMFRVPSL